MFLGRNEEGQGLAEYALVIVLAAIIVVAILIILGDATRGLWMTAWTELRAVFIH